MGTTIHVHTPTDRGTVKYVEFMWDTMLRLASHPEHLFLHVHSIGPSAVDLLQHLKQSKAYHVQSAEGGSAGHAACIMNAFKLMNDGDIHIISDSDAFVVAKGWDNVVRKRIKDGVGMAGTTYEDLGGFSSGNGGVQTYKDVPTFTWALLSSEYDWASLDVTPNKNHRIAINTEELSKIYNLPIGKEVFGEAGWQLPQFLHTNKIPYQAWKQLKPTRGAAVLNGLSDYHEEYHVDNVPFVVHHRGSLRHKYRESRLSIDFFHKVDRYLEKEVLRESRWPDELILPWTQLSLFNEEQWSAPQVQRYEEIRVDTTVNDVQPNGWLKVTILNVGVAIPKKTITTSDVHKLSYAASEKMNHIRIEGSSNCKIRFEIPSDTHGTTVRNTTNVSVIIQKDATTQFVEIESGATSLIVVDVDGVFKAT